MNNPPAFPLHYVWPTTDKEYNGMSLRDYMAAKAMQAIMGDSRNTGVVGVNNYQYRVAKSSYEVADAMLKAREI